MFYENAIPIQKCKQYAQMIETIQTNISEYRKLINNRFHLPELSTQLHIFLMKYKINLPPYKKIHPLFYFNRYAKNQDMYIHQDHFRKYEDNLVTKYTLVLYLNDDFEGGETVIYDTDGRTVKKIIKPKQGSILIFPIDQYHSVKKIKNNSIKYVLITELLGYQS